jgi:hypothetical protein
MRVRSEVSLARLPPRFAARYGPRRPANDGRGRSRLCCLRDGLGWPWLPIHRLLEQLKGKTKLKSLSLRSSQITDDGLAHLEDLTNLLHLTLDDTQITDAGLTHIKDTTRLRSLWLGGCDITGSGLTHLRELSELRTLSLGNTVVKDAVRAWKQGQAEVFVPLVHAPAHAQVDYGEVTVRLSPPVTRSVFSSVTPIGSAKSRCPTTAVTAFRVPATGRSACGTWPTGTRSARWRETPPSQSTQNVELE